MQKALAIVCLVFLLLTACLAQSPQPGQPDINYPRLNEISLILSAEDWVTTQTARVVVGVDANLDQSGLEKLQAQVMDSLTKFAKEGSWRITQHLRNQDQSGLETVHIEAEARLPESQLGPLREQAKAMSKPGFKYSVLDIQYSPTVAEVEAIKDKLRKTLYDRIANELTLLNKTYSGQNYYVHTIDFNSGDSAPVPMTFAMQKVGSRMDNGQDASGNAMPASQKLTMTASAVISSTIQTPK